MTIQNNKSEAIFSLNSSKIAIFKTKWYAQYVDNMVETYEQLITSWGGDVTNIYKVSGIVELPLAVQTVLERDNTLSAVVCFGAVVKGETYHFETITNESLRCIADITLKYRTPIINEVLPVYNIDQLKARTANDKKNKGIEAAIATAETINFYKSIGK